MDQETFNLLIKADSLISYLHHRGYINYQENGCPTEKEVTELYSKIRGKYEKYAKENGIRLSI